MSRTEREKGLRVERELVALHAELGIKAERVPLSGAMRYQGNVSDIDDPFRTFGLAQRLLQQPDFQRNAANSRSPRNIASSSGSVRFG